VGYTRCSSRTSQQVLISCYFCTNPHSRPQTRKGQWFTQAAFALSATTVPCPRRNVKNPSTPRVSCPPSIGQYYRLLSTGYAWLGACPTGALQPSGTTAWKDTGWTMASQNNMVSRSGCEKRSSLSNNGSASRRVYGGIGTRSLGLRISIRGSGGIFILDYISYGAIYCYFSQIPRVAEL
jgi:hypothetical protein